MEVSRGEAGGIIIQVPQHGTRESSALLHAELDKMCCRDPKDDFGVFYIAKPEYGTDWSESPDGDALYLSWDDNARTFKVKYQFNANGQTAVITMQDGKPTAQCLMGWARGFEHAKSWICDLIKEQNPIPQPLLKTFEHMQIHNTDA